MGVEIARNQTESARAIFRHDDRGVPSVFFKALCNGVRLGIARNQTESSPSISRHAVRGYHRHFFLGGVSEVNGR